VLIKVFNTSKKYFLIM